ncbi:GAF domain-containing protein [Sansalvadorimonas sp. 2012CJ34-2]|uniref:GAF domain-containing protein n=1 Tax=Parendozoicomonas callyspongiae TaxID=2942213 RepID=A0ABT0PIZ5_9GAMM|nr:GAF domain-containing protein [Sansalvadorimonas sp. 2012CJ34-2]
MEIDANQPVQGFYSELNQLAGGLLSSEADPIAGMANLSSFLYQVMQDINWAGFYIVRDGQLVLGPFHGKPACTRIPLGKGVCGTAAGDNRIVRVADVGEFPGHIACDAASRSEIVLPVTYAGQVVAVLDIDSPIACRFSEEDEGGLAALVKLVEEHLDLARL